MSLKNPETFGEKYLYGPLLRAGASVLELPLRLINGICKETAQAVYNVIGFSDGKAK